MTEDQKQKLRVILFATYVKGGMREDIDTMDYIDFVLEEIISLLSKE